MHEKKEVLIKLQPQTEISAKIFDDCTPFKISKWDDVEDNSHRIKLMESSCRNVKAFIDLVEQLGDIEHTSDWDPYLTITLRNGEQTETDTGYWNFEIKDGDLEFEGYEKPMRIPIIAIREISLNR